MVCFFINDVLQLEDAYASVIKSLGHAALAANHKLQLTHIAAADLEEEMKQKVCTLLITDSPFGVRILEPFKLFLIIPNLIITNVINDSA